MCEVVVNEKKYNYDKDMNLLDFIESKGIEIHSVCRQGFCGACRCKLIKGYVDVNENAIGYVSDGEFLACSSRPIGDIEITTEL